MKSWRLTLAIARRELRSGLAGFRIFLACLALGVAAIAAIGSFSRAVEEGLRADARLILGGDLELRVAQRGASDEQKKYLESLGQLAEIIELRTMAHRPTGSAADPSLIQLKAVDGDYPLFGGLVLQPAISPSEALSQRDGIYGAAVEDLVLRRLNAKLGDRLTIGDAEFEIRAVIMREPDRGLNVFAIGPRVMIALDAVPATGLLQPGSLMSYNYMLALKPGGDYRAVEREIRQRYPDAGWRIRGIDQAGGSLRLWVDRLGSYLGLIGLAALLVGGVGVGNAIDSFLVERRRTIAALKCLGASGALVWRIYIAQLGLLSLLGVAIGLAIGAALPFVAAPLLAGILPVDARVDLYVKPLALAGLFGLLIALLFALWPLARARAEPAATLMRGDAVETRSRLRLVDYLAVGAVASIAVAAVVLSAAQRSVALWFVVGAIGTFIAFPLLARLVMAIAARIAHPRHPTLRLALANLHRPGAATVTVMLSLGLGLTMLVATALIESNLRTQVQQRIPVDAPALFFVDIQPGQMAEFDRIVAAAGGTGLERAPSLRGRITRIAGKPVNEVDIDPDARWAIDSDRGLTYAATPPAGSRVVEGQWWPEDYRGAPLVSFDANLAKSFGVKVGDTITVNLLGRDIEAHIANLRVIDWTSLALNFTFVFAPGTLEKAPQTWLATVKARGDAEEAVYRAVTSKFPNITVIRVKDALDAVSSMLANIGLAARLVAAISILAGLLVLGGAMAATQRRRVHDTVVMKVLGASRRRILETFVLEFAALGLVTAATACALGSLGAWLVVTKIMNMVWSFPISVALLTALGATAITLALGLMGAVGALRQRPLAILRNE
ncbi:MAG: FtsX-like permease family protein [Rhodospirillales bacterium]